MNRERPPEPDRPVYTVDPELQSCAARPGAYQHGWDQIPGTDAVVCKDCGLMARLVVDPPLADDSVGK